MLRNTSGPKAFEMFTRCVRLTLASLVRVICTAAPAASSLALRRKAISSTKSSSFGYAPPSMPTAPGSVPPWPASMTKRRPLNCACAVTVKNNRKQSAFFMAW